MAQVQARKDKIVKGLTGGIELLFKKNKIEWIKGSGRLAGKGTVEVTDGQAQMLSATREIIVATGSQPRSVPGRRDRPQADHHERRSDRAEGDPEVDRDSRKRRGRRRVRVDLPALRERGHDRRAAATAGAGRRRGRVGGAREVVQAPGHQGADRHEGGQAQGRRRRRRGRRADARRHVDDAHGRVPARRHRARPGHGRPRRRGSWPAPRARLRARRTRDSDRRARHLRDRRRHHVRQARPSAARAPVVGRRHRAGRAHRRAGVPAHQLRPGARLHVLRSRRSAASA